MQFGGQNHPFVVWAASFLWLTSMFAFTWSLVLFFCVGDILLLTSTDFVNALVLLSGIIMLPTTVSMLCSIAHNRKIVYNSKVLCCPLWFCIVTIIIINAAAAIVCFMKIWSCQDLTSKHLLTGMRHYRSVPKYKHFIDNLQWSLKCCGLNSYKDWFSQDWYDKIRDYEWNPSLDKRGVSNKKSSILSDSVPLSCCKSGSCISNYLSELGTFSINTPGCGPMLYRIVMVSMNAHLVMFILIVIIEIIILILITKKDSTSEIKSKNNRSMDVRHIMTHKDRFLVSSGSCHLDGSDDVEASMLAEEHNNNIMED